MSRHRLFHTISHNSNKKLRQNLPIKPFIIYPIKKATLTKLNWDQKSDKIVNNRSIFKIPQTKPHSCHSTLSKSKIRIPKIKIFRFQDGWLLKHQTDKKSPVNRDLLLFKLIPGLNSFCF